MNKITQKHINIGLKVHAVLKKEARKQRREINGAFADEIISLGLAHWKCDQELKKQSIT